MRVIVVGAGIAGLSTAWSLAKRGAEVTLLEQGPVPNPMSASGDQHRIIRRAYGGQSGYQRRIDEAYQAWDELWADIGEKHLVDTGFLVVSQTEGDEAEEYRDGLVAGGYPVEELEPEEAARRFPFLDAATIRFAAVSPEGGVLLCQKIAASMKRWLLVNGVDIRENTKVIAVDAAAGSVTLENGEALSADHIVVTAGAWVLGLVPELAENLTTYRTAVAYLEPPVDLKEAWESAPVILDVGGTVDGYVLPPVAGTGLKVGAGIHKYKSAPDENRVALEGEGEQIRDYFGPPFARISEYGVNDVVTCAYTFTADEHYFAKSEGRLTVVSACSGHGYKFGAEVGRRIAEGVLSGDAEAMRIWLEARD
ncbi:FAD-dependent oxidoreductase [Rhizobiales bacterium]|uniref:NAD(P)/FAD-dependent oxidoreductase n=1 Tax=Hongsoonwoonella zoysiae TaxID=2821844 RepID=UPI00155F6EB5|nr:FAD-dependent oxidoreductase [Hongsoonwoonella zoysiae]NRG17723.1 FAD-dependent oxidoreductase [Hongsoonwoonella zoysiae]